MENLKQYPDTFHCLSKKNQDFIRNKDREYHFTVQNMKKLLDMVMDFETWQYDLFPAKWKDSPESRKGKQRQTYVIDNLEKTWNSLKNKPVDYSQFQASPRHKIHNMVPLSDNRQILGECPVASPKTRCCNLKTLDAVINCGFQCSYCSVQSFFQEDTVLFHENLKEKLKAIHLDKDKIYHIGTGQASDSLLWKNHNGMFDHLMQFASDNPNVILELKSKSAEIGYFAHNQIPPNVVLTWSLNTPEITENEELLTSSLNERLEAAEKISSLGIPVGFHFHPMVWHVGWKEAYGSIAKEIMHRFTPDKTVMISIGTLTFIKPVLKMLRKGLMNSRILQMPLEECKGKYSYPLSVKRDMFSHLYESFNSEWKEKVFFYLCMEDPSLWETCLKKSYRDNEEFEADMLASYSRKLGTMNRRK